MFLKRMRLGGGMRWFLFVAMLGGAPLITAASCDPVSGNLQFFRDDDFGDFADDGFFDDHHHDGGGFFFDFYEEDVYVDDYFYDDCFDCFY